MWWRFLALLEGVRLLWALRHASGAFLDWRLGTVYGSFDRETGHSRRRSDLLRDLWRDRTNVLKFLAWRRQMRIDARRKRKR